MKFFWKRKSLLFIILCLAVFFRFNNLNWDENQHLHPDERFLTMVGNSMKIPQSFPDYFNSKTSTLNPNNVGYDFFVYGTLPLTLNKILAAIFKTDNYNDFTTQGRFLSGLADTLIVLLVYKIVELLEKKWGWDKSTKLWAAFFYAIAVLPIQLAHFFTVDTFLNLFMFLSFYFAVKLYFDKKVQNLFLSSLFFGLAMACKVTAVFILPLNLSLLLLASFRSKKVDLKLLFIRIVIYGMVSLLFLYLVDPYIFSKFFFDNLTYLKTLDNKDIWYPPGVQWINKSPITFSLTNLVVFGVGIPYAVFIFVGIISNVKNQILKKNQNAKSQILNLMMLWILGFFLYQSIQYVKSIRYFIFIYPFLAIFAGIGVERAILWLKKNVRNKSLLHICYLSLIVMFLMWPLMFSSIYMTKNSRIQASEWIYKNLPNENLILGELWDDQLPLYIKDTYGKHFVTAQLPVFDWDTPQKWQKMNDLLFQADYYVLSSNRGWGSILTAPEKYPLMSKFYNDLLTGKTNYKIIKEFTSYPSLRWLGIPLDFSDQWSDEAFTVYDHPKVILFKKNTVKRPSFVK